MRIWSILLIKSDLKWCIHLSTSLFFILVIFYNRKNKAKSNNQFNDLLHMVDRVIADNDGGHYSNGMYEEHVNLMKRQEEEIKRKQEEEERIRLKDIEDRRAAEVQRQLEAEKQHQQELQRAAAAEAERLRRI